MFYKMWTWISCKENETRNSLYPQISRVFQFLRQVIHKAGITFFDLFFQKLFFGILLYFDDIFPKFKETKNLL